MKKISLTIIFLLFTSIAFGQTIYTKTIASSVTIAASGVWTSEAIPLDAYRAGFYAIQITLTGDGTAKLEYQLSIDGTNYLEPASASDIATGFTKTSGPGSDGKGLYDFFPMPAKSMKIIATETGGASTVTVTLTLALAN